MTQQRNRDFTLTNLELNQILKDTNEKLKSIQLQIYKLGTPVKLNHQNYLEWSKSILSELEDKNLIKYINYIPNDLNIKEKTEDEDAIQVILEHLSKDCYRKYKLDYPNTKTLWLELKKKFYEDYEPHRIVNLRVITRSVLELKYFSGDLSRYCRNFFKIFINDFRTSALELKTIDCKFDDRTLIELFLIAIEDWIAIYGAFHPISKIYQSNFERCLYEFELKYDNMCDLIFSDSKEDPLNQLENYAKIGRLPIKTAHPDLYRLYEDLKENRLREETNNQEEIRHLRLLFAELFNDAISQANHQCNVNQNLNERSETLSQYSPSLYSPRQFADQSFFSTPYFPNRFINQPILQYSQYSIASQRQSNQKTPKYFEPPSLSSLQLEPIKEREEEMVD